MPLLSLIRGAIGSLVAPVVETIERALEISGDPDLPDAIQRDRQAIRNLHDRLNEAYAEIADLEGAAVVQQRELDLTAAERRRLNEENARLTRLLEFAKQSLPPSTHGMDCSCSFCKDSYGD